MSKVIKVEQRLQDLPQFFFLPADEAVAVIAPVVLGLVAKQAIMGFALGLGTFFVWKRVKGERGLHGLAAAFYWVFPKEISPFKSFPDSAVSTWRA